MTIKKRMEKYRLNVEVGIECPHCNKDVVIVERIDNKGKVKSLPIEIED